jgi:hypothetical protein
MVYKKGKFVIPSQKNNFRPWIVRAGGILFITLFAVFVFSASNIFKFVLKTTDFIAAVLPAVLTDLANSERSVYELPSLVTNSKLASAAQAKADDMALKGYFSHVSPDGTEPWQWIRETGYGFVYAGENLAVNFDESEEVNSAWMNSPGHRANILSKNFTEVGIAVARGTYQGADAVFVVQMFGNPTRQELASRVPVETSQITEVASAEEVVEVDAVKEKSPQEVASVSNIVPVAESEVLGKSGAQIFVAVQDLNAESATATEITSPVKKSSYLLWLATSPTKVLKIAYLALGIILFVSLISIFSVRHAGRKRHAIYILIMLALLGILYFVHMKVLDSKVQIESIATDK